MIKGKSIFIDGPDRSGKTTLVKNLFNFSRDISTNNFICDRSMITSIVYAKAFDRSDVDIDFLISSLLNEMASNNNIYVILLPPFEFIKKNLINEADHLFSEISDHEKIYKCYDSFLELIKEHSIDNKSVPSLFKESSRYLDNLIILNNPDSYESDFNEYILSLNRTYKNSKVFSDLYSTRSSLLNVKEICNQRYFFYFNDLSDLRKEIILFNEDVYNSKDIDIEELTKFEALEQRKIISDLKYNMHIEKNINGESLESRRFISVSSSCMSYFGFNFRENKTIVNINFRSSNFNNHIFVDTAFILHAIKEYILFSSVYFNNNFIKNNRIVLNVTMSSAHFI